MKKNKILREPAVTNIAGCSGASLRRMEKLGLFPKRRRIGVRAVGWLESEVMEWIAKRDMVKTEESKGGQHE